MYQFKFVFTPESYIAFNLNYAKTSNTIRQMQQLLRGVCPIVILIAGYYITGYKDLWGLFVFAAVASLWLIYYPKFAKRTNIRLMNKLIKEEKIPSLGKWHQVTLEKGKITEVCEEIGSMKSWTECCKVEQDENYVFLYVSNMEAVILPKVVVGNQLNELISFCEENLLNHIEAL